MTAAPTQTRTKEPVLRLVRPLEPDSQGSSDPAGPAGQAGSGAPVGPGRPVTADGEAMREVWQLHGSALMRFALKLTLGDKQRAEDIVQETLVRAWRHPEVVGSGRRAIRSWLFTVTRNVAIDMWRARSRADEIIDDEQDDRPDPAEPIEQAITALDVRAALRKLTLEHRQVIVEMYCHGRSVAEIADALHIPAGTVKSRAYYGLRQLRQVLSAASGDVLAAPVTLPRQTATA
jgi:RNA polymerase sigma-70 factor, ECF subfamily